MPARSATEAIITKRALAEKTKVLTDCFPQLIASR
jgi:hypothetical protein